MDANRFVIQKMEEAFNRRDWAAFGSAFSDEVTWGRYPAHAIVPRAGYVAIYQDIARTFPDCQATVERLIAEEDWVAERIRLEGTHLDRPVTPHHGDLRSTAPTRLKMTVWEAHFWRLRDGFIVEHEAVRDDLGLFRQLGILPPT